MNLLSYALGGVSLGLVGTVIYFAIKLMLRGQDLTSRTEQWADARDRADLAEAKLAAAQTTIAAQDASLTDYEQRAKSLEDLYAKTHLSTDASPGSRADFVQTLKQLSASFPTGPGAGAPALPKSGPAAPGPNGLIDPFVPEQS